MVEMTNAIVAGVKRPIQFFHMPVPKARTDDAYFAPLEELEACAPRPSSISASSITTTQQATRRGSPPPGATRASTASAPNAAWRAAIRRGCRRCSPRTPAPRSKGSDPTRSSVPWISAVQEGLTPSRRPLHAATRASLVTSANARITRAAPARLSVRAQASAVAPVVMTSSTSTLRPCSEARRPRGTLNAPATLRRRWSWVMPTCDFAKRVRCRRCGSRAKPVVTHREPNRLLHLRFNCIRNQDHVERSGMASLFNVLQAEGGIYFVASPLQPFHTKPQSGFRGHDQQEGGCWNRVHKPSVPLPKGLF